MLVISNRPRALCLSNFKITPITITNNNNNNNRNLLNAHLKTVVVFILQRIAVRKTLKTVASLLNSNLDQPKRLFPSPFTSWST